MSKRRQNFMHKSDKLFSRLVRERDQTCQAAGTDMVECKGNLQAAHIHSRSYKSIRTNFENCLALCAAHHTFYTHRPLEWEQWVRANLGDARWDDLRALALRYDRVNWKERHLALKEMAEALL